MAVNEWLNLHKDVEVKMLANHTKLSLIIVMTDASHAGRTTEREIPFQQLPLEQGEIVVDDYICSVYEQLYQDIKNQRSK